MGVGVDVGIAKVVELALSRQAWLGAVRLVAVDGPSGSGKTSLAPLLAAAFARALHGTVIRPERRSDSVDRADGTDTADGTDNDDGASRASSSLPGPVVTVVSTDLLATWEHPLDWWPVVEEHLLSPLAAGSVATMPVVEWVSGNPRPGGSVVVPPVDVLVLEGVSSGRQAVSERLSTLAWVEVPGRAERLERATARDGESMRPFLARWQVDEDAHFLADGTRARADIVIDPS